MTPAVLNVLKCTIGILADIRSFNRHLPAYAIVTLRKFRLMLESRMDMIKCVQETSVEIQTLVLWNLLGNYIPDPLPTAYVIAHQYSSITLISATTSLLFKNTSFILLSSSEWAILKMCNLKLRLSRNVCT